MDPENWLSMEPLRVRAGMAGSRPLCLERGHRRRAFASIPQSLGYSKERTWILKPRATPVGHLERSEIPIPLKLSKGRNLDLERSLSHHS